MPLGSTAFWGVVLPVQKQNLIGNSSFELGTAGWGTVTAGTIGTTSATQTFGAWAGSFAPTSSTDCGALYQMPVALSAGPYAISAYVKGAVGTPYRMAIAVRGGASLGSTTFTGGGTWQRYSFQYNEVSSAVLRDIWVTKANSASTDPIFIDGVQVESGSVTTYIDGDQDGCIWLGAPHLDISFRSGQSRSGGSVVALADLGFAPVDQLGVGMAPIENSWQSYAIIDGAQYQRTRARERSFTLTSTVDGASFQNLHTLRRQIINTFKIDAVDEQQATRFYYTGAGGTVQLDAYLDGGLEGGQYDGYVETVGVKFIAPDPMWESTWQQGTTLPPRNDVGSMDYAAYRDPQGRWGTMPGLNNLVVAMYHMNGTIFVGGQFGSAGGTAARGIAQWARGSWGTLTGGTLGGFANSFASNAAGTLFVGGAISDAGGTAGAKGAVQHVNGKWGTLGPGTLDIAGADTLAFSPSGTLFAGGQFQQVAGTVARFVAQWTGAGWGTLTGGTLNNFVNALRVAPWGTLYAGGSFTLVAGTQGTAVAQYNGVWGTMGQQFKGNTNGTQVNALAIMPSGVLVAGGRFGSIGAGSVNNIAGWNGQAWQALSQGIGSAAADTIMALLPGTSGDLIAAGVLSKLYDAPLPTNAAYYNGYSWAPLDISIVGAAFAWNTLARDNAGTLYVGGLFFGSANAASVTTIVNNGMANAYPTVKFRNIGASGTARVWELNNTVTSDSIYFNLSLLPGEEAVLKLTPGARSFQSNFRGNIFGNILTGSNLATWRLLPGTNYVAHYCDSGSVQTSIYWSPRHHSADAGTTF